MDLHSRVAVYHLNDGAGHFLARGDIEASEEAIGALARSIKKHTRFYVEASTSSAWFARLVDACGHQVVVVDPNRLRAISSSPKKTDAHDAEVLAELGRAGLLTPVHVRSEAADRFRRAVAARHALVRARSSVIRTIRAFLRSEGHLMPASDGDDFARRLTGSWGIPEGFEQAVTPLASAVDSITEQVQGIEDHIHQVAQADHGTVRRLRTIPRRGNSATRALLVQAAWAHLRRFTSRNRHAGISITPQLSPGASDGRCWMAAAPRRRALIARPALLRATLWRSQYTSRSADLMRLVTNPLAYPRTYVGTLRRLPPQTG
jgi:transposase